jgi:hypothetical protein
MLSSEEIEKRKPLWLALSDLWLDSEPTDSTHQMIVREMLDSGCSLEEIERIYAEEVAPAVYTNLLSPRGAWSAFDADWLYKAIIENLNKQKNSSFHRTWIKSATGRFVMTKMVSADWQKITELYKSSKSA